MAKRKAVLADPTRLTPFDSAGKQILRVVIETPKGSRNKAKLAQVTEAFLEIKKFDIAKLKDAHSQKRSAA